MGTKMFAKATIYIWAFKWEKKNVYSRRIYTQRFQITFKLKVFIRLNGYLFPRLIKL